MKSIILQGLPGVGKTTLIKKISVKICEMSLDATGFYTEELRDNFNSRIGFDIVTLDGIRGILARKNLPSKYKVGTYNVQLEDFERIALPIFEKPTAILIIDEIGKMELFSKKFETCVETALANKNLQLIATVPLKAGPKLVQKIKESPDIHLITVTKENRDNIFEEILLLIGK